uniref:Uncharacterized protein n=1 Tax=Anguilla anguilla TaxID=7936 RepID=A0A0E9PF38_ANGAN
MPDYTESTV